LFWKDYNLKKLYEQLRNTVYSCQKETTHATDIKKSSMNGDNSALPVTNLLSISHILYDHALAKMRDECVSLKLQLFWKDYNLRKLKEAMAFANEETGPKCTCRTCRVAGRFAEDIDINTDAQCTFKVWFESHMKSLDIQTQRSLFQNEKRSHICLNGWNSDNYTGDEIEVVFDDDSHFSHLFSGDNLYWVTYGSKLWKASNINDKELQKLKSLFEILLRGDNEA